MVLNSVSSFNQLATRGAVVDETHFKSQELLRL